MAQSHAHRHLLFAVPFEQAAERLMQTRREIRGGAQHGTRQRPTDQAAQFNVKKRDQNPLTTPEIAFPQRYTTRATRTSEVRSAGRNQDEPDRIGLSTARLVASETYPLRITAPDDHLAGSVVDDLDVPDFKSRLTMSGSRRAR